MFNCSCGAKNRYGKCCGPYIEGKEWAPTPEALMRSRYSAYTKMEMDYLYKTLHPGKRSDYDEENARKWAEQSKWLGLEIRATEGGGEDDSTGMVEFVASYEMDEEIHNHHEKSEFRKVDGKWFFYDGKVIGAKPVERETPKLGRNDPCSCGSGKKYKKCCAA